MVSKTNGEETLAQVQILSPPQSSCSLMDRVLVSGTKDASSILARSTMDKLKREFSAGCVVFKKDKGQFLFLIGKHSGYHKWVLPKGLIEQGEKGWQTAVRETKEEMGVEAQLLSLKPIYKEQYFFYATFKDKQEKEKDKPARRVQIYQEQGGKKTRVFKTVSFYLGEYKSGDPKGHDWEMEQAGWFNFKKAFEKLEFKGEKQALQKAKDLLKEQAERN